MGIRQFDVVVFLAVAKKKPQEDELFSGIKFLLVSHFSSFPSMGIYRWFIVNKITAGD
jgi:hypothetical protein